MTNADRRIARLATGQLGTFTRAQAYDAGLSDRQLRRRVQSGILLTTGPNSFRVAGAPTSLEAELRSVVADVGGDVWVTGPTAAALHGFDGMPLRRPFHLLTFPERSIHRTDTVIHRVRALDPVDRAVVRGLPVTSGVRTVIEIARKASRDEIDHALESLFLLGLSNEGLLLRRIASLRGRGRHGIPALLDAIDRRTLVGGTESWLERAYVRLLDRARLPLPQMQQVLSRTDDRIIRVDCRFPGTNVVVELLGYRYHRSRSQMSRDAARLNQLVIDGFLPYQFTFDQVADQRAQVVRVTTAALTRSRRIA